MISKMPSNAVSAGTAAHELRSNAQQLKQNYRVPNSPRGTLHVPTQPMQGGDVYRAESQQTVDREGK